MKLKLFVWLFIVLVFAGCGSPNYPNKPIVYNTYSSTSTNKVVDGEPLYFIDMEVNGMAYRVFYSGEYSTAPFAVNLTKDALEVEKLKRELKK